MRIWHRWFTNAIGLPPTRVPPTIQKGDNFTWSGKLRLARIWNKCLKAIGSSPTCLSFIRIIGKENNTFAKPENSLHAGSVRKLRGFVKLFARHLSWETVRLCARRDYIVCSVKLSSDIQYRAFLVCPAIKMLPNQVRNFSLSEIGKVNFQGGHEHVSIQSQYGHFSDFVTGELSGFDVISNLFLQCGALLDVVIPILFPEYAIEISLTVIKCDEICRIKL